MKVIRDKAFWGLLILLMFVPLWASVQEPVSAADEPKTDGSSQLTFSKNERIALVGNSLAERMNLFGHFETLLHSRFANLELKVRNFGWPADEVANQQRPNNYTKIDDPMVVFGPDTFICFFGLNESYAGAKNALYFKQNYNQYLDSMKGKFSKGSKAPRFVLVSPTAFEATGNRLQPTGEVENVNLAEYTKMVKEIAEERKLPYIDLYTPTLAKFGEKPGAQYTINGIHLNEEGDKLVGKLLDAGLFGSKNPADIGTTDYEKLRAAVNDKSWTHLNDYRMLNGWYVYGGRRTYDKETFPLEYKKIRAMVAVRDRYVWDISQKKDVALKPDDSKTGKLIIPPTGVGRHYPRAEPKELKYLTPEECIKTMEVPEGFEVQPFASEIDFPELANPCQMNFDNKGRLWVACMPNYPQWRPGDPNPDDRLLIFEDSDNDGKADKCKVFYDKLICPTGFEFWNGGVLVVDEPRILFLKDTDGDDKADVAVQLLDGIATDDTHHTMGAWEWSHGGLLYMLEGVSLSTTLETPWGPFRNKNSAGCYIFDPVSLKMRRFKTPGYGNPWCMVFDEWGNEIVGDGTNAKQHWGSPLSGADPRTRRTTQPIFDNKGMRPAVGSEFLMSRHLPDDVQKQFIYACVINMNGMPRFTIEDQKDQPQPTGQRIADLLKSTDKTFRPVDPQVGPDGAIWFGDWCNALIGHMQYSQRDPNRDHTHGRVYRLVNKNKALLKPVTQYKKSIPELLEQLKLYELRWKYRVRRELRDREPKAVLAALKTWVDNLDSSSADYEKLLCEALWVQESMRSVDTALLKKVMSLPSFQARAAAVHVLGNEIDRIPNPLELLEIAIADKHPRVRLEAVRAASLLNTGDGIKLALLVLDHPVDNWIDYTLQHALLANQQAWLASHVKGELLADASDAQKKYLEKFMKGLGKTLEAIKHLQIVASNTNTEEEKDKAVADLAKFKGNARNGRVLFNRVCSSCHELEGRGINFGPDLTKIHTHNKPETLKGDIIYSIIEPNKVIDKKYETMQIVTADGKAVSGFVEKDEKDAITLRIAGGKLQKILKSEILDSNKSRVSSMPEGFVFTISPDEFIDLTEYLYSINVKEMKSSRKKGK